MPKRILICEDDEEMAEDISAILTGEGYSTFVLAKNGDPAYVIDHLGEKIKEYQPNYIILDGLDGLWSMGAEITKRAKPDISTVVLSGNNAVVKKAQKAGFAAFDKSKVSDFYAFYEFLKK